MPSYVVKVNREEDFYVLWSDVTESPHVWGDRAEVEEYMKTYAMAGDLPERFDRADKRGTSAFPGFYDWEDSGFIYEQRGFLPRSSLRAFLESYDGYEFDLTLLEPFDD